MIVTILVASSVLALCGLTRAYLDRTSRRDEEFCGGRVRLTGVWNEGSAFGLLRVGLRPLMLLSAAVLASLAAQYRRGRVAVGLALGGGVSNLLERLRLGKVYDYVQFPKAPGKWKRYVYNLADFAIFLGTIWLCLRKKGFFESDV